MDVINEKMIAESGNRAIAWIDMGFRVIANNGKPIEKVDDLRGLKMRVPPNQYMLAAFNSWGCNATPLAWGETINALQQGVVDGLELNYPDIAAVKLYETLKYLTEIHYKLECSLVVVNEEWLQSQPEDVREAIIKAGKDAMMAEREYIAGAVNDSLELLKSEGMTYVGVPKDEDVWMEKAMATWPQFYKEIGGVENLEEIMTLLGRELPQ